MDLDGQYNGVNGISVSSSPASGGGGDIILSSSHTNKSKKGLLIGIIVALFAIILATVIFFVYSGSNRGILDNVNSGEISPELRSAYNSFVNYLVLGEDSDEKPNFSEAEEETKAAELIYTEASDVRDNYFFTLLEKYNAFADLYNSSELPGPEIETSVKGYYYDFASLDKINVTQMQANYDENGLEKTEELIKNRYAASSENKDVQAYFAAWKEFLLVQLPVYDHITKMGCVNAGIVDNDCARPYLESQMEAYEEMNAYHQQAVNALANLMVEAESTMESLQDFFYAPTDGETGDSQ